MTAAVEAPEAVLDAEELKKKSESELRRCEHT